MRPIVFSLVIASGLVLAGGTAEAAEATEQESLAEQMLRLRAERLEDSHDRWALSSSELELACQLNALRVQHGVGGLEVDARSCATIRRRIRRCFEELGQAGCHEGAWIDKVDRYVADWDKRGFTALSESEEQLLGELQGTPAFREALLRPDATHLALATGSRLSGESWCVVYITRRVISLNDLVCQADESGHAVATYLGTSSYRHVRARFYRGAEDPLTYQGEDYCTDFETNEGGEFQVTLPVSMFGEGEYRVVFYVRKPHEPDYRIAACVVLPVRLPVPD